MVINDISIEKEVIDTAKFEKIYEDNLLSNPWLLNNQYKPIDINGVPATVYSGSYKDPKTEQEVLIPSVFLKEDGKTLEWEEDWEKAKKRSKDLGFGITFNSAEEATEFSKWLSKKHENSIYGE